MIEIVLILILLVLFIVVSCAWLLEQKMGLYNAKIFLKNSESQQEKINEMKRYIAHLEAHERQLLQENASLRTKQVT